MNQKQIERDHETVPVDIKEEILRALQDMDKRVSVGDKIGSLTDIKHGSWVTRLSKEIKNSKKLIVEFKVDKTIKKGLKSGRYTRRGGVIVNTADNTVVKWLEEVKFAKAGKALNIAAIALDIFSEIALNEKLKELENKLETVKELAEAEHWQSLYNGLNDISAAIKAEDKDHRRKLLYDAREGFRSAKSKNDVLLYKKIEKINELLGKFNSTRFDNHKLALKILEEINKIFPILSQIILCCRAQGKIYEQLGDLNNAKTLSKDALGYQAAIYDYLYPLLKEKTLEIERKEIWDSYVKFREKILGPASVYNILFSKREKVKAITPEFYIAKWRQNSKLKRLIEKKVEVVREHDNLRDELLFITFKTSDSTNLLGSEIE